MIRVLAIILNLAASGFAGFSAYQYWPLSPEDWCIGAVVLVPLFSAVVLIAKADRLKKFGWFATFLKRKALEEQRRIDELASARDAREQ